MSRNTSIEDLADAISRQLNEYRDLSVDTVKKAVTKAGNRVKKEIGVNAPVKTGKYAKSWRTKKTKESATELHVTVYSPTRYMIAHLLEHGHAKRGGGRVNAIPHIKPAQDAAEKVLVEDIERGLRNG